MSKNTKRLLCLVLAALLTLFAAGCGIGDIAEAAETVDEILELTEALREDDSQTPEPDAVYTDAAAPDEDVAYTSKEDVALFLHVYGRLPDNFVTKTEARNAGWEGGSLEPYLPGCCIGGDSFGNREGLLPDADGRYYTECDIDTLGASSRGARRIVFSNDGLIYYTGDHYASFELLYGEE